MERNLRVLVIDDDINVLDLYRAIFCANKHNLPCYLKSFITKDIAPRQNDDENFELTTVNHGLEGVNVVAHSLADGHPYAVAFIENTQRPSGMDGLETARRIRALDEDIHIIMVTGYNDHTIHEIQSVIKQNVLLIYKPVTCNEIRQLARNACDGWSRNRANQILLHESKSRQFQAIESYPDLLDILWIISDGVMFCDFQGMVQSINPAAVQMLQISSVACLSRYFYEFFENVGSMILERLAYEKMVSDLSANLVNAVGQSYPVRLNMMRLSDEGKTVPGLILVIFSKG